MGQVNSRRFFMIAALTWITLSKPIVVFAERAPVPEDELNAGSDLIVVVKVLSVMKTGKAVAPHRMAQLEIQETLKGRVPPNPMEYRFVPPERGLAGARNESVFAGQSLKLYLIRDTTGHYIPWASNSIELLERFGDDQNLLPTKLGEVIYANGMRCFIGEPRERPTCESHSSSNDDICRTSQPCPFRFRSRYRFR